MSGWGVFYPKTKQFGLMQISSPLQFPQCSISGGKFVIRDYSEFVPFWVVRHFSISHSIQRSFKPDRSAFGFCSALKNPGNLLF